MNKGKTANSNLKKRYRAVLEEFEKHDCREVPITVIWSRHIYPRFFISRVTLYRILKESEELRDDIEVLKVK